MLFFSENVDYIDNGDIVIIIPAQSMDVYCVNYTTNVDNERERDENFIVEIKNVTLLSSPVTDVPNPPTIGDPGNTNVVIQDVPPDSRVCMYDSISMYITTFSNTEQYLYNRTCEHALTIQRTSMGEFGVFFDSLDGTFKTSRVGVRIGLTESIVVNAYNRTIIRQTNLTLINVDIGSDRLSITVPFLQLAVLITADGVSVIIDADSVLTTHTGLCGNINGDFVFRNGTPVDITDDYEFRRALNQYMIPPSETILRMVSRRECGKLWNLSVFIIITIIVS